MRKVISVRINAEQEKIIRRFKEVLSRKYGKIHGVFSNKIVELIDLWLSNQPPQHTHTNTPQRYTRSHRVLARVFFALPNGNPFPMSVINEKIQEKAGGDPRTVSRYRTDLFDWALVMEHGIETDPITKKYVTKYERGKCPEWFYELKEEEGPAKPGPGGKGKEAG